MNILKLSHIISKFLFLAKQATVDVYAPKSAAEAKAILGISQQEVLTKELLNSNFIKDEIERKILIGIIEGIEQNRPVNISAIRYGL